MTFEEAITNFRAKHAAEWYVLSSSAAWREARAILVEFGGTKELIGKTPLEVRELGVVLAAQAQGHRSCIEMLDNLLPPSGPPQEEPEATYAPDTGRPPKRRGR